MNRFLPRALRWAASARFASGAASAAPEGAFVIYGVDHAGRRRFSTGKPVSGASNPLGRTTVIDHRLHWNRPER